VLRALDSFVLVSESWFIFANKTDVYIVQYMVSNEICSKV